MTGVTLKIDFETEALQQALARLKRQAETLRFWSSGNICGLSPRMRGNPNARMDAGEGHF